VEAVVTLGTATNLPNSLRKVTGPVDLRPTTDVTAVPPIADIAMCGVSAGFGSRTDIAIHWYLSIFLR
jgi:hypothetical protein